MADRYSQKNRSGVEDSPGDIPDLVAEILARAVERRLRRNLSFGYQPRQAILSSRVRGRIDHLYTERRQLLHRELVACRFEELTVDTPRNRYVRAALEKSAKMVQRVDLSRRCRALATGLVRMGVSGDHLIRHDSSVNLMGRTDTADRQMLAAAQLAFDLALPTETAGPRNLSSPYVDIQGHNIRFATVNLDATPREIRHRLLKLIDPTLI